MSTTEPLVRRRRHLVDLRRGERVRYERMVRGLGWLSRLALGAALAGLLLPDPVGKVASALAVAVVLVTPLFRVAWLAVRWYGRGDRRYAAVAVGLLLIIALGSAVALVTR